MPPVYRDKAGEEKIITSIMVRRDLFEKFRIEAAKRYPTKGFLSKAIEDAIKLWLNHSYSTQESTFEDDIDTKKKKFGLP